LSGRKRIEVLLRTAICGLLGIKYPIIQGGMAHVGTAELAAAALKPEGWGAAAPAIMPRTGSGSRYNKPER